MPVKAKDTTDAIVQRLRALVQQSPDLQDAARIYETMLPLLRDADLHVSPVSIRPDQIRAKMDKGEPLLPGLDLELDVDALHNLMLQLARAVETTGGENSRPKLSLPWVQALHERPAAASRVRLALEMNRLDISTLLPHITAGESGPLMAAAPDQGLDPDLVWTLAQNALKPALRAWCRQLTPLVNGNPWFKGYCYVCGAAASFAELQENDQVKHLRCGSCGADWQVRRLQCIYCGNEDHRTRTYLFEEKDRERIQIEACDKCKGYLKVIAAFTPTLVEMLAVEDLATLHLDYIATERGYTRGVLSR